MKEFICMFDPFFIGGCFVAIIGAIIWLIYNVIESINNRCLTDALIISMIIILGSCIIGGIGFLIKLIVC